MFVFSLVLDTARAAQILDSFQKKLKAQGDTDNDEELERIKQMLESPLFRQLLMIQQSVRQLNDQLEHLPPGTAKDFEFSPTGELVFPRQSTSTSEGAAITGDNSSTAGVFEEENHILESGARNDPVHFEWLDDEHPSPDLAVDDDYVFLDDNKDQIIGELRKSRYGHNEDFQKGIEMLSQGRQIETVTLMKPEQGGLGFSVVGLKSENRGELGIFIQEIQKEGVAGRYYSVIKDNNVMYIRLKFIVYQFNSTELIYSTLAFYVFLPVSHGTFKASLLCSLQSPIT